MSDFDFDRSIPRPRRQPGFLPTAALTLLLMGVILVGAVVLWAYLHARSAPSPRAEPLPTRERAKERLIGKSKEDVLKILGRPDRTSEYSDGDHWRYDRPITHDPISGRDDSSLSIWFDAEGKVERLVF